jgi:hypothetical protein
VPCMHADAGRGSEGAGRQGNAGEMQGEGRCTSGTATLRRKEAARRRGFFFTSPQMPVREGKIPDSDSVPLLWQGTAYFGFLSIVERASIGLGSV